MLDGKQFSELFPSKVIEPNRARKAVKVSRPLMTPTMRVALDELEREFNEYTRSEVSGQDRDRP
jgi:hypothetical protein